MLMCGMVVVPARPMVMTMLVVAMIVMGMVGLAMSVIMMVAVRMMIVAARRMVVVIVAVNGMSHSRRSRLLGLQAARNIAKLGHALFDLGGFGLCLVEDQRQRLICDGQGNPGDTR